MSEEGHECEYKLIMDAQDSNMKRLIADLGEAKTQRNEAVGLLRVRCDAHDLPVVDDKSHPNGTLKYHDIGPTAKQRGHSDNYPDGLLVICDLTDDERTFLASLNIKERGPGPSCVWCGAMDTWRHTKEGKVWERGCQCERNQSCERVSVCCGAPEHSAAENFCAQCQDGTGFKCNVHEVEWGEGECPEAVRTANNTQQEMLEKQEPSP